MLKRIVLLLRQHPAAISLGLLAVISSHLVHSAYVLMAVVLFCAVVALLRGLGLGALQFLRPHDARPAAIRTSFIAVGYCLLLCLGLQHGKHSLDRRIEERFAPLIPTLEDFKHRNGHYPETLTEVPQPSPTCPGAHDGYSHHPAVDGGKPEFYCITCMTVVFLHHTYCSSRPRWIDWD